MKLCTFSFLLGISAIYFFEMQLWASGSSPQVLTHFTAPPLPAKGDVVVYTSGSIPNDEDTNRAVVVGFGEAPLLKDAMLTLGTQKKKREIKLTDVIYVERAGTKNLWPKINEKILALAPIIPSPLKMKRGCYANGNLVLYLIQLDKDGAVYSPYRRGESQQTRCLKKIPLHKTQWVVVPFKGYNYTRGSVWLDLSEEWAPDHYSDPILAESQFEWIVNPYDSSQQTDIFPIGTDVFRETAKGPVPDKIAGIFFPDPSYRILESGILLHIDMLSEKESFEDKYKVADWVYIEENGTIGQIHAFFRKSENIVVVLKDSYTSVSYRPRKLRRIQPEKFKTVGYLDDGYQGEKIGEMTQRGVRYAVVYLPSNRKVRLYLADRLYLRSIN